jgi:biotin carboxyl carrier protein
MQFIRQQSSIRIGLATAGLLALAAVGAFPWRAVAKPPEATIQLPATAQKPRTPPVRPEPAEKDNTKAQAVHTKLAGSFDGQAPSASGGTKSTSQGAPPEERRVPESTFNRERNLRVFALKYAQAEEVAKHLQTLRLGQDTDAEKVIAVADPRTNAVIVQAPPDEMRQIGELIQTLDLRTTEDVRTGENRAEGSESDRPIPVVSIKPGYVQKVFVTSGKAVKRGDPLIQLENEELEGKLNNAVAQLDIAKATLAIQEVEANGVRREYDRLKVLAGNNAASSDEVESKTTAYQVAQARVAKAQAELRLAEQQVRQAKTDFGLLTIRAPKDGTVTRVRVQAGEYLAGAPSQQLLLIRP